MLWTLFHKCHSLHRATPLPDHTGAVIISGTSRPPRSYGAGGSWTPTWGGFGVPAVSRRWATPTCNTWATYRRSRCWSRCRPRRLTCGGSYGNQLARPPASHRRIAAAAVALRRASVAAADGVAAACCRKLTPTAGDYRRPLRPWPQRRSHRRRHLRGTYFVAVVAVAVDVVGAGWTRGNC